MGDVKNSGDDENNYAAFRDCLFAVMVEASNPAAKSASKRRKGSARGKPLSSSSQSNITAGRTSANDDPAELADFSDFIASEIFPSLPEELRSLSHQTLKDNILTAETWSLPLSLSVIEDLTEHVPPSVTDNLHTYGLIEPPKSDTQSFIAPVIASYVSAVTTPPPKWIATRTTACEVCERDWIPLTYHHLIPKAVHAKVLKRGWHDEQALNSVAWLCRACHTFVHKMASHEELAREWFTVEKICSRDDVQKWALWVGKVRWKKT